MCERWFIWLFYRVRVWLPHRSRPSARLLCVSARVWVSGPGRRRNSEPGLSALRTALLYFRVRGEHRVRASPPAQCFTHSGISSFYYYYYYFLSYSTFLLFLLRLLYIYISFNPHCFIFSLSPPSLFFSLPTHTNQNNRRAIWRTHARLSRDFRLS